MNMISLFDVMQIHQHCVQYAACIVPLHVKNNILYNLYDINYAYERL